MTERLDPGHMAGILQTALQQGRIDDADTAVFFHNLDFLRSRIETIQNNFGGHLFQAVAIKANPLPRLLDFLLTCGVGAEAATMGEVYLAEKCGYAPQNILFDSPAKTKTELSYALKTGIHINVDSFSELGRIAELRSKLKSDSKTGLRVNPQIGDGSISITSVAGHYSKFAIPLDEFASQLRAVYDKYPWLNGIHVHIGSQGCNLGQLSSAVRKTLDFAQSLPRSLDWIDIGGGLPVTYREDAPTFGVEKYAADLRVTCPELFNGQFKILSEFGRYTHANAGWAASRVEYVKKYSGHTTIINHVGADLLMRRCYLPDVWHHDISVCTSSGELKKAAAEEKVTIAGPLCFGGDIIARDILLPVIEEGDYLLIHDTGAYTTSMASRHTSRQLPMALGYSGAQPTFRILKKRESLEDVYHFWE